MRESFEHFYMTKVGLGEGCGCAEHVTRIREIDSYAANRARAPIKIMPPVFALLAHLFRRRAKRNLEGLSLLQSRQETL